MSIIAYPLNNILYNAEDAMLFNLPVSSGVYAKEGQFNASISSGLSIEVSKGLAFIRYDETKGFTLYSNSSVALSFDTADSVLPRIDRVVLRWIEAQNKVEFAVKKGSPSSTPTAPIRQTDSSVYELVLYDVRIQAGATSLTASDITDQRLNESLCGVMANNITKLDTAAFDAQLKAIISEYENDVKEQVEEQLQEAKDSGAFKGDKGDKGEDGDDGYTPQRGLDYWTEADKTEIIDSVLANFTNVSEVGM